MHLKALKSCRYVGKKTKNSLKLNVIVWRSQLFHPMLDDFIDDKHEIVLLSKKPKSDFLVETAFDNVILLF